MARDLILHGKVVHDETEYLADDAVPSRESSAAFVVSCERWLQEKDVLLAHHRPVGVRLTGTCNARQLRDSLPQLSLVVIDFPKFGDGRGYSQARILREQLRFTGELRARGDVLRDQAFYLKRCGFSAFEPTTHAQLQGIIEAFTDFSVTYQGAADVDAPAWRRFDLPRA
jgi:uncharacterized protein (DUF934 family)